MPRISDEEVIAALTEETPLDAYFFIGERLIGHWHPSNGVMVMLIHNGELSRAYKRVLRKRGARRFNSSSDAFKMARLEKWPNWEKFVEAYEPPQN